MEVIVKEIVAKLNGHVFGRVASTETENKLAASIIPGLADATSAVVDLYAADHDPRQLADNALEHARARRNWQREQHVSAQ